jgi:hypothetical protein
VFGLLISNGDIKMTRMGKSRGACRILAGKRKGRRPLGIPGHRWEDNIKMAWGAQTGSIWFRIGTGGGLFLMR